MIVHLLCKRHGESSEREPKQKGKMQVGHIDVHACGRTAKQ